MNPKALRFFSLVGIVVVMILSALYGYRTYQQGETRWYFFILAFAIAILLVFNMIGSRQKRE
ncbi:MAG: hypothetical protein ACFHWX_17195 [Bacteroidota bacterium]